MEGGGESDIEGGWSKEEEVEGKAGGDWGSKEVVVRARRVVVVRAMGKGGGGGGQGSVGEGKEGDGGGEGKGQGGWWWWW